jgi:Ser/Thr protein kinase RdoA (MazF antagonist)
LCRAFDVEHEVDHRIRRALTHLTPAAIDERVPHAAWSLTSGDLAPHNILVREDGGIRVLDFVYSGWDDPAILVADFLAAESAQGLAPACSDAFARAFRESSGVSGVEWERAGRVRCLMEVGWIALHLQLLIPRRFAMKQFADLGLDLDSYVQDHIAGFHRRLATADRIISQLGRWRTVATQRMDRQPG